MQLSTQNKLGLRQWVMSEASTSTGSMPKTLDICCLEALVMLITFSVIQQTCASGQRRLIIAVILGMQKKSADLIHEAIAQGVKATQALTGGATANKQVPESPEIESKRPQNGRGNLC